MKTGAALVLLGTDQQASGLLPPARPRCVLPPAEQTGERPADLWRRRRWRRRGSSESRPKLLLVPEPGCCSALTWAPDRGEDLGGGADGPSLFRRDSMENGPLNFTSLRFWTPPAAAWGPFRLPGPSGPLLPVWVSTLEASSGKSCRSPLKCRRTILGVICLESSFQWFLLLSRDSGTTGT